MYGRILWYSWVLSCSPCTSTIIVFHLNDMIPFRRFILIEYSFVCVCVCVNISLTNIKCLLHGMIRYNWLSLRVVVLVVIFSVSPFSWPFDMVVMIDLTTTVFELVSVVSLEIAKLRKKMNFSIYFHTESVTVKLTVKSLWHIFNIFKCVTVTFKFHINRCEIESVEKFATLKIDRTKGI